jgi:hypothetical protein
MKKLFFLLISIPCGICSFAQLGVEGAPVTLKSIPAIAVVGQPVLITGTIMVNDKAQSVSILIKKPSGATETIATNTDVKGIYKQPFAATDASGWYSITAKAQDGKGMATDSFYITSPIGTATAYVNRLNALQTLATQNINVVLDRLNSFETDPQLEANKEKLRQARQRLHQLRSRTEATGEAFSQVLHEINTVPPAQEGIRPYQEALEQWQENADTEIPQIESQINQFQNVSTTCENINNIIETLSLVSWIMNFQGKFAKIMLNIASDKVLPGAVDRMDLTGSDITKESKKLAINQTQKTLTAAAQGMDELAGSFYGMAGDLAQYVSKVLYALKCVDIKGPATVKFTANMHNGTSLYWKYGVDLTGNLTLRYEKNADLSKPSEVTGEFEGFRTRYEFWEKIENVEPLPKGIKVLKRFNRMPKAINASAITNDIALVGRTVVPGSYRVKVKGQLVNNQLTLEVIKSPSDFTETIENNRMFLIGANAALPIPLIKTFTFPIAKSRVMFVVGLGDKKPLAITKTDDKISIKQKFTTNRDVGTEIKLSSTMDINISN